MTDDEVRHGRRRRRRAGDVRDRQARAADQGLSTFAPMAENMVSGTRDAARRRAHHVRRHHRRGDQHRRRGPADPGRRPRPGHRAEARRDPRRRHPHRPHGVALGDRVAGVLGSDDVVGAVLAAARDRRRGDVADADPRRDRRARSRAARSPTSLQHDGIRWGGGLFAAAFLREFTAGLPWAHLDIAGPAFNSGGPYGHVTSGGTGSPSPRWSITRGRSSLTTERRLAVSPMERSPRPRTSDGVQAMGSRRLRLRCASARSGAARLSFARTTAPAASCGGCSRASAAGRRRRRRRTTAPGGGCRTCGPSRPTGTRRRVHSPSWATSSSVTSLTAVRGSTNPSTPLRAADELEQVRLVGGVGRAHAGRPGACGIARGRPHPSGRAPAEPVEQPHAPSVPCPRSGRRQTGVDTSGRSARMGREPGEQ